MLVQRYWLTVPLKIALLIKLVINFPDNNIYKISDIYSASMDDEARRMTRPHASFDSQIHQQTTTCFKIDFFSNFFLKINTGRRRGGGPRRGFRPPSFWNSVKKVQKKIKKVNFETSNLKKNQDYKAKPDSTKIINIILSSSRILCNI
jgi:hypothetical protein